MNDAAMLARCRDLHAGIAPGLWTRVHDAASTGERQAPRLHFRRGHWRHLTNHKVWVNWTLVGDPDLGFIDKHYRL